MKHFLLVSLFFVSCACATLKQPSITVDYLVDGLPTEFMLCHLLPEKGDMHLKCISVENLEKLDRPKEPAPEPWPFKGDL